MNRMMRYADFQGFLFSQKDLMTKKDGLRIDQSIELDACVTTSVPPFMIKMEEVIAEHKRFCDILDSQGYRMIPRVVCGLQNPPEDITLEKDFSVAFVGNFFLNNFHELTDAGIRVMGIAYELENSYGGGFAAPYAPLTQRGKDLLWAMANVGMVLDLSHAGHQTARDAIAYIIEEKLPLRVVASHTACHAVYGHGRNLPDDVLRGIADLGGVIGLATATFMLHPSNNTLEPFYDHLHHLLKVVGADHVALGTDGIYRTMDVAESEKLFQMMKDRIDPRGNFQARYPDQPLELNRPDRLDVIAQGMLNHGISPATVEKVMGKNLIGFLSEL